MNNFIIISPQKSEQYKSQFVNKLKYLNIIYRKKAKRFKKSSKMPSLYEMYKYVFLIKNILNRLKSFRNFHKNSI